MRRFAPQRTIAACAVVVIALLVVWLPPHSAMAGKKKSVTYELEKDVAAAWKEGQVGAKWKIPLQGAIIEDMRFLAAGRMLLSLRENLFDFPVSDFVMVDTDKGKVLWRYERAKRKGAHSLVLTLADVIIYRVDYGKKTEVVALSSSSGKELWSVKLKSEGVQTVPVLGSGVILTVTNHKAKLVLTAYGITDGKQVFTLHPELAGLLSMKPAPVSYRDGIIIFFDGIRMISGQSGEEVWKQSGQSLAVIPTPQLDGNNLYLVNRRRELVRLNAATGAQAAAVILPEDIEYTNIYPVDGNVYLRGMMGSSTSRIHFTTAVVPDKGKVAWTYQDTEPSVSSIIEKDGRVYFATPSNLVCLDAATGKRVFSVQASRTGKDFPADIINLKDRIVFMSEMILAAYDPVDGGKVFRYGFTPVSNEAGLDGLGKYIRKIEARMGVSGGGSGTAGALADQFGRQSRIYQDQSSANWSRYRSQRQIYSSSSGVTSEMAYWDAANSSNQAQIDSAFSAAAAQLSFHFAMMQLETSVNAAIIKLANESRLKRFNFIHRTILSAYDSALIGDYIFRPSQEDDVVGVSVVHMPSGKMTFTGLSPQFEVFGLFNIIDVDKSIVYHQGLRRSDAGGPVFENYLLASPITLPR